MFITKHGILSLDEEDDVTAEKISLIDNWDMAA